jgi:hypothetical protein
MALVAALLAAGAAGGQNLLANGSFDDEDQLDGWLVIDATWAATDAGGDASSGSAQVVNSSGVADFRYFPMNDCVAVAPSTRYLLRAAILLFGTPAITDTAVVGVVESDDIPCSVSSIPLEVRVSHSLDDSAWHRHSAVLSTGPETHALLILLGVHKLEAGSNAVALFDDIFLTPVLFADGFESGSTDRWGSP